MDKTAELRKLERQEHELLEKKCRELCPEWTLVDGLSIDCLRDTLANRLIVTSTNLRHYLAMGRLPDVRIDSGG